MKIKSKQQSRIALTIIISAVIMRLVPHIPNFAPLTAGALFAAAYLPKRYVLIIPLVSVAISDYLLLYINPFSTHILNFSRLEPMSAMFNSTTAWVWGSFMISGLLGLLLRQKQGAKRVFSVSVLASLQFYLVTNFGVWAAGAYARNLSGLGTSYVAGLPFLRATLLSDLFYSACFFGIFALVTKQLQQGAKIPAAAPGTYITS